MKLDEFAFVNHQLAGMIRAGIPLEGALRQTCQTMNAGSLRAELSLLEADLARGAPLREALASRKLPGFYTRMMEIGAQGSDLPALLTLLADYYQRLHQLGAGHRGTLAAYGALMLGTAGTAVACAWLEPDWGLPALGGWCLVCVLLFGAIDYHWRRKAFGRREAD